MKNGFLSFLKSYANDGALVWGGYFKDIPAGKLAVGVKVEKEHKDLYDKLKKRLAAQGVEMPITEQEFYETITKAHFKENDDYYDLLLKYVEKKKMAGGGKTDDFANSGKGRIFVPSKITKDELQSIISGKSKVSNGDTIQSALSYIRREKGSDSINRGAKSDTEENRLIEFIGRNNLWYSGELNPNDSLGRGGEHIVYPDPNDEEFILKTNNLANYSSWSDYLVNLLLNNTFFPDTSYELIGFKKYEHGKILPVVRQRFVAEPVVVANLKDVQKYLFNRGFVKVHPLANAYRNWDLGVVLGDLHNRNVLMKNDVLFFIDTKFFISHNVDYIYGKGGEAGVTPKYKMRDKVKLREPYNYLDENGNTITVTTDDIGVIKYRDDNGREQEFSEWMKDIEEQNKIHGQIGYFVKFKKLPNYIWREESTIMPADDREILYKKIINLIKYEIEVTIKNIPTIRDWDTLETLHDVPYIHISGRKWNGYFRNYSSSATIEKIEESFPKNKTLLRLANIYREYNMNDFYGGTIRQNEALKKKGGRWDYDGAVEYLKSIGLYEDRGYRYGSDWLYKPVPASVVEELKVLSEQLSKEFWTPKLAGGGETGEKTEFMYLAVSKNNSIRFDKPSYVLEYSAPNEYGLVKGKKLTYGYLTSSYKVGAPRGWFISEISMTQDEFDRSYDLKEGVISVKIKMAGGGIAYGKEGKYNILIKIKPNTQNKIKWYYDKNRADSVNWVGKTMRVRESENPYFPNKWQMNGSFFVDKEDAEVVSGREMDGGGETKNESVDYRGQKIFIVNGKYHPYSLRNAGWDTLGDAKAVIDKGYEMPNLGYDDILDEENEMAGGGKIELKKPTGNIDDIYKYLDSFSIKIRYLKPHRSEELGRYTFFKDGFHTAVFNSDILKFWFKHNKEHGIKTLLFPIPSDVDNKAFDIFFEYVKIAAPIEEIRNRRRSAGEKDLDLDDYLMSAYFKQILSFMAFEAYGLTYEKKDFEKKPTSLTNEIGKLTPLDTIEESKRLDYVKKVFKEINHRDNLIRNLHFFFDTNADVKAIREYVQRFYFW